MKKPGISFAIAFVWLSVVTFLLCLPGSEFPEDNWLKKIKADKWVHVILFMLLVLVWCRAYAVKKNVSTGIKRIFIWITITGFLYGIVMEVVQQYFITFRSFETGDILADGAGCFIGYFFAGRRYIKK